VAFVQEAGDELRKQVGLLRRGASHNDGVALVIGGLRLALRAALFRPTSSERDVEQKFFAELFFKKATACFCWWG
jgi:hypothetical protein